MPLGQVMAYAQEMPRIRGHELLGIAMATAVGTGSMPKENSERIVHAWSEGTHGEPLPIEALGDFLGVELEVPEEED